MPRILIVDDDRETCRFMAELLARPDREIEIGRRPRDGAARSSARTPFDLVISDINLNADAAGLDVLRAFRRRTRTARCC